MDQLDGIPQTRFAYLLLFTESLLTVLNYRYEMDPSDVSAVAARIMKSVNEITDPNFMLEPPIDESPRLAGILVAENTSPSDTLPMTKRKIEAIAKEAVMALLASVTIVGQETEVEIIYELDDDDDDDYAGAG